MRVAIIGSKGVVGRSLVEHFEYLGHDVLSVDRDSILTLEEAATAADVVFVVTFPIEEVNQVMLAAAEKMSPGTLLMHGTSVECPRQPYDIDQETIMRRGITLCHCHFHFRPEVPLSQTLGGQNISVSMFGPGEEQWRRWVWQQFEPSRPIMHCLERGEHDRLTVVSQLTHMVVAFLVGSIWLDAEDKGARKGISLGGPPCRMLVRSVLRTAGAARVISGILINHPQTPRLIEALERALGRLKTMVAERNGEDIEATLCAARQILPAEELKAWDETTDRLVKSEASCSGSIRSDSA